MRVTCVEPNRQPPSLWPLIIQLMDSTVEAKRTLSHLTGQVWCFQNDAISHLFWVENVSHSFEHPLPFYSFLDTSSGENTTGTSSRMGAWSDADSPNCQNMFPDCWVVGTPFSLLFTLLKVLDQNWQDVASKHSTPQIERVPSQQPGLRTQWAIGSS